MKKLIIMALSISCLSVKAQITSEAQAVTGVVVVFKDGPLILTVKNESQYVHSKSQWQSRMSWDKPGEEPTEFTFVDYNAKKWYQMMMMPNGNKITNENTFEYNQGLTVIGKEKYHGWECKIARTIINSNTIDIWYTDNLGFKGTPYPAWGIPDGLVLKVVRNGVVIKEVESTNQSTSNNKIFPENWGKIVSRVEYMHMKFNYAVKKISVFKKERIGFLEIGKKEILSESDKVYRVGGGTVILKKVILPENSEDYNIFAEVVQRADGDAYDRIGSVFVIPTGKEKSYLDALGEEGLESLPFFSSAGVNYHGLTSTPTYDTPVELIRFFTPFGVGGYNHIAVKGQAWADSVIYKADVTDLASILKGEVWVGAYIGNWDPKGHILSLDINFHPATTKRKEKTIIPLFNTLNIMEQAGQPYPVFMEKDMLSVDFNLPQGYKNAQIAYITTGHGGWAEGDEFNKKPNTIYLNGKKIFSFLPWRQDCGSYRNLNPASGNFDNGLSSSDLSRSNWCPGTVTNPIYIPLGDMKKGKYNIKVQIPQGPQQDKSISYWCISAYIIAEN